MVSFLFVFGVCWLGFYQVALIHHQPNLTLALERCHYQFDLLVLESEFSLTVGEEDEVEEDDEE